MAQLDRNTDLYKRYVKKFSAQEDTVEKMREQIQKLTADEARLRKALDDYLAESGRGLSRLIASMRVWPSADREDTGGSRIAESIEPSTAAVPPSQCCWHVGSVHAADCRHPGSTAQRGMADEARRPPISTARLHRRPLARLDAAT